MHCFRCCCRNTLYLHGLVFPTDHNYRIISNKAVCRSGLCDFVIGVFLLPTGWLSGTWMKGGGGGYSYLKVNYFCLSACLFCSSNHSHHFGDDMETVLRYSLCVSRSTAWHFGSPSKVGFLDTLFGRCPPPLMKYQHVSPCCPSWRRMIILVLTL